MSSAASSSTLLKQAFASGRLAFHGQLRPLRDPAAFEQRLNHAVRHDWVVYAKRPFASPTCVLKYLARYTHGVAISNRRLVALHDGQVSFRYKDYADQQQSKILTLHTPEFIRRFLLHTLPRGFVRIRYYGFLANRQRNERLEHCRRLLGVTPAPAQAAEEKILLRGSRSTGTLPEMPGLPTRKAGHHRSRTPCTTAASHAARTCSLLGRRLAKPFDTS